MYGRDLTYFIITSFSITLFLASYYENTGFWLGDLRERYQLENLEVNGSIVLKLIFRKWYGKAWNGLI
jgi:hypothetical protein